MSAPEPRRRESILRALLAGEASTPQLARRLNIPQRSTRRQLRGLIREGYAFAVDRGRYRITLFGRRAVEGTSAVEDRRPLQPSPADVGDELARRASTDAGRRRFGLRRRDAV